MLWPLSEGGGGSKAAKRPAVQVHGRVEEREATKKIVGRVNEFLSTVSDNYKRRNSCWHNVGNGGTPHLH
jgi:hypothetical protein